MYAFEGDIFNVVIFSGLIKVNVDVLTPSQSRYLKAELVSFNQSFIFD
jgi:hypothetical protein